MSLSPEPGTVLNGRYRLQSRLGRGGMCTVYEAHDEQLDRLVALKFLNEHVVDETAIERFRREATVLGSVHNPHIVDVFGFGVWEGRPFLAMELIRGRSLADLIAEQGALPLEVAKPIFLQLCEALAVAHEHGVIHRDIKPSNVMLVDADGEAEGTAGDAKLVDFGIAGMLPVHGQNLQKLTQTGSIVGTVAYMSPEQCSGERLDARSDLYSLGCLMYEALEGHLPFEADNQYQVIYKHGHQAPPVVSRCRPDFARVIEATMAKRKDERPQSARQLAEFLRNPSALVKRRRVVFASVLFILAVFIATCLVGGSNYVAATDHSLSESRLSEARQALAVDNYERAAQLSVDIENESKDTATLLAAKGIKATALRMSGQYSRASDDAEFIRETWERHKWNKHMAIFRQACLDEGISAFNMKDLDKAVITLSEAVSWSEDNQERDERMASQARAYLGTIEMQKGQFAQAVVRFERALPYLTGGEADLIEGRLEQCRKSAKQFHQEIKE